MKFLKNALSFISAAVMLFSFCGYTAYAENTDKVVDNAGLLTDSQESDLERKILEIIEEHDSKFDIAILTENGTGGKSAEAHADDYYESHGYGYGSDSSGLILFVDMDARYYHISTCGQGITVFTDYGLEWLEDGFLPYLSDGDYGSAFSSFADRSGEIIEYYETNGEPYDTYSRESPAGSGQGIIKRLIISLIVGVVIALIVCMSMRSQLNSVRTQTEAMDYVRKGSFRITNSSDVFLYKTVSRIKREPSSSSSGGSHHSGGGSSVHHSSSGMSHGGRGGHF